MAPGATSSAKISSTPETCTASLTASAMSSMKPIAMAPTRMPRAWATSSSSEANSSGRKMAVSTASTITLVPIVIRTAPVVIPNICPNRME